jgi:hypothetical protein
MIEKQYQRDPKVNKEGEAASFAVTQLVKHFGYNVEQAQKRIEQFHTAVGVTAGAFGLVTAAVGQVTGSMGQLVEALSPVAMDLFNSALEQVHATIGQALLPVIEVFTAVLRRVADILSPLMQQLAPLFRQLALVIGDVLIGAVTALVGIIVGIAALFGDAEGGLKGFRQAMQDVVRMLVRGVAYLVKAFAGAEAVAKWAKMVGGVGEAPVPVPKEVAIKGIGDVANTLATAAFAAAGATEEDEEMLTLQRAIKKDLEQVAADGATLKDWLLKEFIPALFKAFIGISVTLLKQAAGPAGAVGASALELSKPGFALSLLPTALRLAFGSEENTEG